MKFFFLLLCLIGFALPGKAQRRYCLDYTVPDQYKIHRWGAEVNFAGIPAVMGYTIVNGVYSCNVARWFSVGAGVGVMWAVFDMYEYPPLLRTHAFLRLRFEAPHMRVSPFLMLDAGANMITDKYERFSVNGITNWMAGARFWLRNGDKISAGIGLYTLWFGSGCVPFGIIPLLHFGYTF